MLVLNVTTDEAIFNLTVSAGASLITIRPGAGQAAILRVQGSFVRSSPTTANPSTVFRGSNLGLNAPGTANSATLTLFTPTSFGIAIVGGGGVANTPTISIIGASFTDTSSTGFGTQIATYDLVKGVRPLNPATEYTTLVNGTVTADNVRVSNTTVNITAPTTVNALWLDGSSGPAAISFSPNALGITSNTILVTGTGNSISNGTFTYTWSMAIGGPGDLTISSAINLGTQSINKSGAGTLFLSNGLSPNTIGDVTILSGTIDIANAGVLGSTGSLRFVGNGGSIQNTSGSPITLVKNLSLDGDITVGGNSDLSFNGNIPMNSAGRTFFITNTGTTTLAGVVSTNFAGNSLTKAGPGLLVLTNSNTYGTGGSFYGTQTIVNGGELRVNNSTGSGTGGTSVVVNTGGTLSGNGFILPQQTVESRNSVLVNSGGTISSSFDVGVTSAGLTIGSATTPGVTTAAVTIAAGGKLGFNYSGTPTPAGFNSGTSLAPGTNNTMLTVQGTLTVNPLSNVVIKGAMIDFDPLQGYSFLVATATTVTPVSITNQARFDTTGFAGYGNQYFFSLAGSGNSLYLNATPVPEPASLLLIGAVGLGGFAAVRRRRAKEVN